MKKTAIFVCLLLCAECLSAQFLMDMVDTTTNMGKGLLSIYKKFDRVNIGGYIQPEFQVTQEKGAKSYAGGDFAPYVSNRFMIRRGRLRFEYARFTEDNKASVQFVFQFDGTERGVFIRDFWGRYFENKWELFSVSMGMFARPFGYEINLASSDRESPERGRMSQILMKTERDLGAMLSFEPRKKGHPLRHLKVDVGVFNGPGLTSAADYDNYKDLIVRVALKSGETLKGVLIRTTRDSLTMQKKIRNLPPTSIAASDISSIRIRGKKALWIGLAIGAGTGVVASGITGYASYSPTPYCAANPNDLFCFNELDQALNTFAGAVIGGLTGSLVGLAIGSASKEFKIEGDQAQFDLFATEFKK